MRWIELPADQARHEAAKRSTDLVCSRREVFSYQADHPTFNSGDFPRNLKRVHAIKQAGLDVVLPRNPKKIQRVHIPHPNRWKLSTKRLRNEIRIAHLRECRNDDSASLAESGCSLYDVGRELFNDL